jgi:hypothetical protein
MVKFIDDDFEVQPKVKDGKKHKGGGSKKIQTGRKKSSSNKEMYNSKHIRIMSQKIEHSNAKKVPESINNP